MKGNSTDLFPTLKIIKIRQKTASFIIASANRGSLALIIDRMKTFIKTSRAEAEII